MTRDRGWLVDDDGDADGDADAAAARRDESFRDLDRDRTTARQALYTRGGFLSCSTACATVG
jgi:hypothetical protein